MQLAGKVNSKVWIAALKSELVKLFFFFVCVWQLELSEEMLCLISYSRSIYCVMGLPVSLRVP